MRLFLPDLTKTSDAVRLTAPSHLAHVKAQRLRVGDGITLCDGRSTVFRAQIAAIEKAAVRCEILSSAPADTEPKTALSVYAAWGKPDRQEYIVQKCVELGAAAVTFFSSENMTVHYSAEQLQKRLLRLQAVSEAAAEQCGRGIIPRVDALPSFDGAVSAAAMAELAVFPYENERGLSMRGYLEGKQPNAVKTASVVTGSEGGFSPAEVQSAVAAGLEPVSLGRRILRCDTAPIAVTAVVMWLLGELE
ncbi:MAG: 16S rRNA (uracil(1498)-N(3))-methyltransferase [Oscillospiraceae bacterium]|jgi:16S rRNA (uracil1498-N3)-methyltransferase|nr:16S rRNA (uracil(1498)-N(3))-methyltransferase [Oscillospiraceae bacterium]